ncbi:hypothetical protein [Ruficoccus sp. ZRK36]|nr:hypothetical protein [Ruficoccus sp. ZRK36]
MLKSSPFGPWPLDTPLPHGTDCAQLAEIVCPNIHTEKNNDR